MENENKLSPELITPDFPSPEELQRVFIEAMLEKNKEFMEKVGALMFDSAKQGYHYLPDVCLNEVEVKFLQLTGFKIDREKQNPLRWRIEW